MKAFLDTGFLLTLLFERKGSPASWNIIDRLNPPLFLSPLQNLTVQNRFQREIESKKAPLPEIAIAVAALKRLRQFIDEQIFAPDKVDADLAVQLAFRWQHELSGNTPPTMILLWPALAVAGGSTHFLSFDPRARKLAEASGLKLLPEKL
jgi:predicted nucleic acid-binding protein